MEIKAAIQQDNKKEIIFDQSLKMKVIQEIEQGEISTFDACLKYEIKDRSIIRAWLKESKDLGLRIKPKKNMIEIKRNLEQKIMKMESKLQFFELENKVLKLKLDSLTKKAI